MNLHSSFDIDVSMNTLSNLNDNYNDKSSHGFVYILVHTYLHSDNMYIL